MTSAFHFSQHKFLCFTGKTFKPLDDKTNVLPAEEDDDLIIVEEPPPEIITLDDDESPESGQDFNAINAEVVTGSAVI